MKFKFPYIFIFAILLFFVSSHTIHAQSLGFVFTYDGNEYAVTSDEVTAWEGQQIVNNKIVALSQPDSVKNSLLNFVGKKIPSKNTSRSFNYKLDAIYDYVKTIAKEIDVPVVEPELELNNGMLTKFVPPQTGQSTDLYQTALNALTALQVGRKNVGVTVLQTSPKKSLSETNNLGINELIAHGTSKFNGSPKNRRHNIAVGMEKFKGLIIKQGEEFSFNKYLGPVEAEQGFLPELVIKGDKGTIPELGGGLCQVSSTTFRAAMEAGLPITQRRNHAYAVQYYSPQGTDATIYPGVIDLKFINDTPGAILVWPYKPDENTLIFDFYGTKDGRQVTLDKPVQYDKKTDGSMKATWTRRVVSAAGLERTDEFKSIYQPPALFHKTEQFVTDPNAPTPPPGLLMPKTN